MLLVGTWNFILVLQKYKFLSFERLTMPSCFSTLANCGGVAISFANCFSTWFLPRGYDDISIILVQKYDKSHAAYYFIVDSANRAAGKIPKDRTHQKGIHPERARCRAFVLQRALFCLWGTEPVWNFLLNTAGPSNRGACRSRPFPGGQRP